MPAAVKQPAFDVYNVSLFFPLLVIFLFLLFNSSLIQSLAVTFGVLQVFLISTCKVVSAAEVFFGAHVYIVVVYVVQYSVNTCDRRNTDWSRGQSGIL